MTTRIPTMYGRYYVLTLVWRGREYDITVFRSKLQKLQRPGAQKIANSVYPGSRVIKYHESDPTDGPVVLTTEEAPKGAKYDRMVKHIKKSYSKDGNLTKGEEGIAYATAWKHKNKKKNEEVQLEAKKCGKGEYFCNDEQKCKPIPKGYHVMPDGMLMKGETHKEEAKKVSKKKKTQVNDEDKHDAGNLPPAVNGGPIGEGAAWTKKSGKNKEGGLNEKGRKSYERENPGSDLKAPSKKKGNKRRASFCARMKGMKKKLTSKKTASDPESRINKSLRAWNC